MTVPGSTDNSVPIFKSSAIGIVQADVASDLHIALEVAGHAPAFAVNTGADATTVPTRRTAGLILAPDTPRLRLCFGFRRTHPSGRAAADDTRADRFAITQIHPSYSN